MAEYDKKGNRVFVFVLIFVCLELLSEIASTVKICENRDKEKIGI